MERPCACPVTDLVSATGAGCRDQDALPVDPRTQLIEFWIHPANITGIIFQASLFYFISMNIRPSKV